MTVSSQPEPSQRSLRYKWLLVLFVLAIAAISTLPNYITDSWTWANLPNLENTQSLKTLQQQGLPLVNWQILEQQTVEIGGHKWSYQSMAPAELSLSELSSTAPFSTTTDAIDLPQSVVLLLRPQTWHRDLPQVDWIDINGTQGWTEDSQRRLRFTVSSADSQQKPVQITARFFRGWNQARTYAVLQWYAWPQGGSSAPSHWFWVDQWSQWHDRQRTPWIAVSLFFPIKPLGDIEAARTQATALGKLVQSTLMQNSLLQ